MTAPHVPDMVTTRDAAGRWLCRCLGCMDASVPTFHRPAVDDWRKAHIKQATTVSPKEKP